MNNIAWFVLICSLISLVCYSLMFFDVLGVL